ncbi:MAG: hypothetical protein ABTQ93_14820 [Candidatus Competibacter denitrificans]
MSAVILIPAKGPDSIGFGGAAYGIVKQVYRQKGGGYRYQAGVQKAQPGVQYNKCFWTSKSASDVFWDAISAASTFIMMSHCGIEDGPILYYSKSDTDYCQPWPKAGTDNSLSQAGKDFWGKMKNKSSFKIVLIGCSSAVSYASLVAKEAQCPVYGFLNNCTAASDIVQIPLLRAIEAGKVPTGMKKCDP